MADKNKNGIPDDKERPSGTLPTGSNRSGQRPSGSVPTGSKNAVASAGRPALPGSLGPGNKTGVASSARGIFSGVGGAASPLNAVRVGKQMRGLPEALRRQTQETQMADTALPSFLANLMNALQMGGVSGVDYDPLRNDARARGAEYDARISAMYDQLQNRMRQDGVGVQEGYQQAIDSTADRTQSAQQNIQGASDAAAARNLQQLQALGIGEAAGNIVQEGRDLNSDTARAVQDAAARGQISGDNLQQNRQSAGTLNNSLVGAAGLEGNLQRARVQSELGSLLAQYDMEEQQARQQSQQQSLAQAMSLAGALTDNDWKQRGYQDDLSRYLAEQQAAGAQANQPSKMTQSLAFLQNLMGSPQFQGYSIEDLLPYIQALGGIGKLV